MMRPVEFEPSSTQLISPKGRPVALSPLSAHLTGMSEALATPMISLLPEPFFDTLPKPSKARSGETSPDAKFVRTVSGASTQVPEESEYNAKEEFSWDHVATSEAEPEELQRTASTTILPLQSDLGRWAQAVVRTEEWLEHQCVEPLRDGPALTPDGRVVDLEQGAPIFFSHDRFLAESYFAKMLLKEEAKMITAARLAHAACMAEALIEAGDVCSIDNAGVMRGFMPPAAEGQRGLGPRLKKVHRKRRARARSGRQQSGLGMDSCLCAGLDGKVLLLLALESFEHRERLRHKRAKLTRPQVVLEEDWDQPVMAVDTEGVVWL